MSFAALFLLADVFVLILAFVLTVDLAQLAEMVNAPPTLAAWLGRSVSSHFVCYLVSVCLTLFFLWQRGLYSRRLPMWEELGLLMRLIIYGAVVEGTLLFLLSEAPVDKSVIVKTWIYALVLVPVMRFGLKSFFSVLGLWARPALIIGTGENALYVCNALDKERMLGYSVQAFLKEPDDAFTGSHLEVHGRCLPVLPFEADMRQTLQRFKDPQVILAADSLFGRETEFQYLSANIRNLIVVPPIRGVPLHGMEVSQLFGEDMLLMQVRNNLGRYSLIAMKRAFDLITASFLLVIFSWLFAYLILRVLQTGRPVFYGHMRVGQRERRFECWKFRTMVPEADQLLHDLLKGDSNARAQWEKDYKLKNDPRVTSIGAFLRRTSLDELPQLWNVIRGEMSLVGPRPVVESELPRYGAQAHYYLQVKPGMTGLWQVSGRNDASYDYRVRLDSWYVRNWSLWHDVVILLKTAKVVLSRAGAY